jgi:alpha-tubulin suppressor-like RCC1 family protein
MTPVSRRTALALLSSLPFATSLRAQSVATRPNRRQFFSGTSHILLLEPDGTLAAWASAQGAPNPNQRGQLGLGHADVVANNRLYRLPGLTTVASAAAGSEFSLAVLDNGQVLAWGRNETGALGITRREELGPGLAPRGDALAPTPLAVRISASSIAAGPDHVLALTREGTVYAWGEGAQGRLGIGELPTLRIAGSDRTLENLPYPMQVPGLTDVVAVAAGFQHSLALMQDGTLRAWGLNSNGQLGDGTRTDRATPVRVAGIEAATAIVAGSRHSAALLADGTVMTWGSIMTGSLGRNVGSAEYDAMPGRAERVTGIRSIAGGRGHMLALTEAGTVMSWGDDAVGATGRGVFGGDRTSGTPKTIPRLSNVVSIAAGPTARRSFALLADGTILTWGIVPIYARPQGDPTVSPSPIPLVVEGLSNR